MYNGTDFFSDIEENNRKELIEFYSPYFSSTSDCQTFIDDVVSTEQCLSERKARQMLNQVMRFVKLASDIEKIYPPRDGLRILFYRICIESLEHISGSENSFYTEFEQSFSPSGIYTITNGFKLSYAEKDGEEVINLTNYTLTIDDFLNVLRVIRNKVAHEGEFWNTSVFALNNDDSCQLLSELTTDKLKLNGFGKGQITYHFETNLKFSEFKSIFIEACLNYINKVHQQVKKGI